jgi:hypothetical protein
MARMRSRHPSEKEGGEQEQGKSASFHASYANREAVRFPRITPSRAQSFPRLRGGAGLGTGSFLREDGGVIRQSRNRAKSP